MNNADIQITKLPAVPGVLVELIEACSDPDVSFDRLARIIKQDTTLTARVVAVCNSAAYAQWNGTRSFEQLLVLLGLNAIKSIAVTTAVRQFFSQFGSGGGKGLGRLWRQSLSCACMARSLAALTGHARAEDAYLGGLLHNLGQLIFLQEIGERYLQILESAGSLQALSEKEQETFGTSAPGIASQLVQEWFPHTCFADAILYQREASDRVSDSSNLVKLLNLACKLVWDSETEGARELLLDNVYGLNAGVLDDLEQRVSTEVGEILLSYGFGSEPDPAVDNALARDALANSVRDQALVGALGPIASESLSAWEQILRNFSVLSGAPVVVGFEYEPSENLLVGRHSRGLENASQHWTSLQLTLNPNRNLLAEACLNRQALSTLDDDLPKFSSVTDEQLRRIPGHSELLALPLVTDQGALLGGLLIGMSTDGLRAVLSQRYLLKYYLQASVQLLQQQQAQVQEKAEALESQAEGFHDRSRRVVHEANNPLNVIKNYLYILASKLDKEHEAQEQIDIIKEEIDRVSDILTRMPDVASERDADAQGVDINATVKHLVEIFRASLLAKGEIGCEVQLDERIPAIFSNRNSIKQVITNLLKNAVEALDAQGTIRVETHDRVNFNGEQYVQIVIADNGPGIPDEILSNIFSPVDSTKGQGHSGLGLAIVKNLVNELNGFISVLSDASDGTRFEILLPRKQSTDNE